MTRHFDSAVTGMSYTFEHVQRIRRLDQLQPHAIEHRLGHLLRHYLRTRSPELAVSIVRHIEALCVHPDLAGATNNRCAYLHLKAHWRCLVESEGTSMIAVQDRGPGQPPRAMGQETCKQVTSARSERDKEGDERIRSLRSLANCIDDA